MVTFLLILWAVIVLGQLSGNQPRRDDLAVARQVTGLELESSMVNVGALDLHVVQAGPKDGLPVVLLHGFPEFWYAWRDVIPLLVEKGFRVIVPDQRGYADSDKPRSVEAYHADLLADDIAGLIRSLGHENACVVAHDVGAWVAWNLALRHAEVVSRLVVINNPHPDAAQKITSTENKISWYRVAFQIPGAPEWIARLFNWSVVTKMLRDTAAPNTFPEDKLALYRSTWDRDGAFSTMVNWYRANNSSPRSTSLERRVKVPTLILLTPQDAFIPSDLVRASLTFLDDGQLLELEQGTHWVIQEHPKVIAREVAAFCRDL